MWLTFCHQISPERRLHSHVRDKFYRICTTQTQLVRKRSQPFRLHLFCMLFGHSLLHGLARALLLWRLQQFGLWLIKKSFKMWLGLIHDGTLGLLCSCLQITNPCRARFGLPRHLRMHALPIRMYTNHKPSLRIPNFLTFLYKNSIISILCFIKITGGVHPTLFEICGASRN